MIQRILLSAAIVLLSTTAARADNHEGGEPGVEGEAGTAGEVTDNTTGEATTTSDTTAEATATGDGPHGPLGFGAGHTLAGIPALGIVYHVGDKLIIQGLVGFVVVSPEMGDSTTDIAIGAAGFWQLFGWGMIETYVGGRLMLHSGAGAGASPGLTSDVTETFIEVPLQVRLQLNRRLAVHLETGLGFAIGSEDNAGTTTDTFQFFLGAGDLFGSAGFTVYI